MPAPLTPNNEILFPKTAVSDGQYILFTPGNPGYVVIEGGGGSGTLPTSDAADGLIGQILPLTGLQVTVAPSAITPRLTAGTSAPLNVTLNGNLRTRDRSTSTVNDSLVTAQRLNQVEVNFSIAFNSAIITNTTDGVNGSAVQANGCATYSTGAAASSYARGVTVQSLSYRPGHEWYCYFTAAFTQGVVGSHQRIGCYNGTDGFWVGYEGITWGLTQYQNSSLVGGTANVAPSIAQAAFNGDICNGAVGSVFTLNNSPVAINFTKINIFRIHGAWFGTASVDLEVFTPDGEWTTMHTFKFPNSLTTPYTWTTNWNIRVDVTNTTNTSNLAIVTPCWGMGTTDTTLPLNYALTDYSLVPLHRAVLTGKYATANTYLNVGVDSNGNLLMDQSYIANNPISIAAPGIQKVGITGGTGVVLDAVIGAAAPANVLLMGAENPSSKAEPLQVDANNELITSSIGLALNSTGQSSVGYASAGLIIAANAARAGVLITNPSTTVTVYIGASNVTTATGAILGPGNSMTIPTVSAVYGIVASGTQNLSFLELV